MSNDELIEKLNTLAKEDERQAKAAHAANDLANAMQLNSHRLLLHI